MKSLIIDVDTGIDDALALSYALHSPELRVLGVTTSFGNISVEEATRNTLSLLEMSGRPEIPVLPGAGKPIFRDDLIGKATNVHGDDGLGNSHLPTPKITHKYEYASEFIVKQVTQLPGQVTVITVGPLTNLATALMREPAIAHSIARVVVMGGAVTVPGNVTPMAEANIYADPEAAEYVFRSGAPLTLVGLDVTMQTLLKRTELQRWREEGTAFSRFLANITDFYMDAYKNFYPGIDGCALHDPLAVGVAIDESFVKTTPMFVQVDTEGGLSLGRTIADRRPNRVVTPNMDVCLNVDAERFVSHFLSHVV